MIQTYSCCKSAVNPNCLGNKSTMCYKTINGNNIQLCSLAFYNIVLMIKSKLGPYPCPSSAAYRPSLLLYTKKCAIEFHILGCKHKRFVCAGLYNILYQSVVAVACAGSSIKTRAAKTLYSLIKTPGSVLVLREVLSEGWKLSKLSAIMKDASHLLCKTVTL